MGNIVSDPALKSADDKAPMAREPGQTACSTVSAVLARQGGYPSAFTTACPISFVPTLVVPSL